MTMEKCRLLFDQRFDEREQRVIWGGMSIAIDRDYEFVNKRQLPKVARVVSPAGRVFDVYKGSAKSVLGGICEFAVAIEIAHFI